MSRRLVLLAVGAAALYSGVFGFAWYAMDTGNWPVVVAVCGYLLLVLAVLVVAVRRRSR